MAVARLGASSGGSGTTSATWTGFNITSSDANTLAVVLVNWSVSSNANSTCSVTYGGVTMKQLGIQIGGSSTSRAGCGIYYLFNPGTGAKSIVATPAGATIAGTRGIHIAFSGVSQIGNLQSVATMAHTVSSGTDGYALRVLSNGVTVGTLNQTSELATGASISGVGDFIGVQSAAGALTVAFTASGSGSTPLSVGCHLTPAGGGIQLTQRVTSTSSAATSKNVILTGPIRVGETIIVAMSAQPGTSDAATSVTDTAGNTYAVACPNNMSGDLRGLVYYAPVTVAADPGNSIIITFPVTQTNWEISGIVYEGLHATAPFDQQANANGIGTAGSSGNTPATTQADELVFGFGCSGQNFTTAGSGYTLRALTTNGSIIEDKVVSSTGAQSATATTVSSGWVMDCATFKKAGAAAAPAPPGRSYDDAPRFRSSLY